MISILTFTLALLFPGQSMGFSYHAGGNDNEGLLHSAALMIAALLTAYFAGWLV